MLEVKRVLTPFVLRYDDCHAQSIAALLSQYGLIIVVEEKGAVITGSYFGESEAGIVGNKVYVRNDTPVHSLLHESCHYVCMNQARRDALDTDVGGDYVEENGVCYLQILLSDQIPEMGKERMMRDMDSWGYTFRLGSAQKWFEEDAEDAIKWLEGSGVVVDGAVTFELRH